MTSFVSNDVIRLPLRSEAKRPEVSQILCFILPLLTILVIISHNFLYDVITDWKTFRLRAAMEEAQKNFQTESKTMKELQEKAKQIEEALA